MVTHGRHYGWLVLVGAALVVALAVAGGAALAKAAPATGQGAVSFDTLAAPNAGASPAPTSAADLALPTPTGASQVEAAASPDNPVPGDSGGAGGVTSAGDLPIIPPPASVAPVESPELPIELTYPQSDDNGHYVGFSKAGTETVNGLVACSDKPTKVLVNGVAGTVYAIQDVKPYGDSFGYPVYRFHAPIVVQPSDQVVVTVVSPAGSWDMVFVPDATAVVARWKSLLAASPGDAWLECRLGSAYYAEGNYTDAIKHLRRASTLDEKAPWIKYQLGMALLAANKAQDAVTTFKQVTVIYPTFPDVYCGLGLAYYTLGDWGEARIFFGRARALCPFWPGPILGLGLVYYVDGDFSLAAGCFTNCYGLWPEWPVPYYALAYVRIGERRWDDASRFLDRGYALGPWRAARHDQLARLMYRGGHYNQAWRQVEISRELGGRPSHGFLRDLSARAADPGRFRSWPWRSSFEAGGGHAATQSMRPGRAYRVTGRSFGAREASGGPRAGGRSVGPEAAGRGQGGGGYGRGGRGYERGGGGGVQPQGRPQGQPQYNGGERGGRGGGGRRGGAFMGGVTPQGGGQGWSGRGDGGRGDFGGGGGGFHGGGRGGGGFHGGGRGGRR